MLSGGEGDKASPGFYRKQSVRVGALIPPPAPEVPGLMSTLEKYMNEASELPPLIRAGLVHVHFETIHPFFDGNGCIGRLLKMRETADLTLDFLFSQPVVSITEISKSLEKAYSTIRNILQQFIIMGIVSESTTQKRNKLYRFEPYLALLEKEYL